MNNVTKSQLVEKMNAYLKEIADLCEINKNLSTHTEEYQFINTCTIRNFFKISKFHVHPKSKSQRKENVATAIGGLGYADVWKRGCFAWEYKGKGKDLNAAYQQLLQYREDLENPPQTLFTSR